MDEAEATAARALATEKLQEARVCLDAAGDTAAAEIVQQAIAALEAPVRQRATRDGWIPAPLAQGVRAASGKLKDSVQAASNAAARLDVKEGLGAAKATVAQKGDLLLAAVSGVFGGFGTVHYAFAEFAANLDWSALPAEFARKFAEAGTHGIDRTMAEAQLVWETIPEALRALGPERVAERLEGFDWSHIVPHSEGGSNEAWNGIFERAGLNRARGAEQMTAAEVRAAEQVLSSQAFGAAVAEVAGKVLTGAALAAAVACVLAALEHGLAYQRDEIGRDEMYRRIARDVAVAAVAGAAISGLMTAVALAFPAVIPLAAPLMLPLAVLGLAATGGKVVRLGKGWYEVLRDTVVRRLEDGPMQIAVPGDDRGRLPAGGAPERQV